MGTQHLRRRRKGKERKGEAEIEEIKTGGIEEEKERTERKGDVEKRRKGKEKKRTRDRSYEKLGKIRVKESTVDNGDLSRSLQPGYNYVGQTNARQPLHIKCCGQVA